MSSLLPKYSNGLAHIIRNNMNTELLGVDGEKYTQNKSESVNAIIKRNWFGTMSRGQS